MVDPQFVTSDYAKIDREKIILDCFLVLDSFVKQNKRLPKSQSRQDASFFTDKIANLSDPLAEIVRQFSFGCKSMIAPMCSVIGAMTAQEALKACTGKFMPIRQHFVFDALECLPRNSLISEENCQPVSMHFYFNFPVEFAV